MSERIGVAQAKTMAVSDYTGFDFQSLWAGRSKVTDLEQAIVGNMLGDRPVARVLEISVGFGRLTQAVRRHAVEYAGLDLDAGRLTGVARAARADARFTGPAVWVEGNAYRLPFLSGSFTAAVAVRLYHHIGDALGFLCEVRRCLQPGGHLILQYSPKPTVGTMTLDLQRALDGRGRGFAITRSTGDVTSVEGERFPLFVPTRRAVLADLARSGFRVLAELGTVPERLQRWLPLRGQLRWAPWGPGSVIFPSRFLLVEAGEGPHHGLAPLESIWACPSCGTPLGTHPLDATWETACPDCGYRMYSDGELVHARDISSRSRAGTAGLENPGVRPRKAASGG